MQNPISDKQAYAAPKLEQPINSIEYVPSLGKFIINEKIWLSSTTMDMMLASNGLSPNTPQQALVGSTLRYDMQSVKAGDEWTNPKSGETGTYRQDGERYSNFKLSLRDELQTAISSIIPQAITREERATLVRPR